MCMCYLSSPGMLIHQLILEDVLQGRQGKGTRPKTCPPHLSSQSGTWALILEEPINVGLLRQVAEAPSPNSGGLFVERYNVTSSFVSRQKEKRNWDKIRLRSLHMRVGSLPNWMCAETHGMCVEFITFLLNHIMNEHILYMYTFVPFQFQESFMDGRGLESR